MIVSKLKIYKRGRRRDLHKPNKPTEKKKKEKKTSMIFKKGRRKKERIRKKGNRDIRDPYKFTPGRYLR